MRTINPEELQMSYSIQEFLNGISQSAGLTPEELTALNDSINKDGIVEGDLASKLKNATTTLLSRTVYENDPEVQKGLHAKILSNTLSKVDEANQNTVSNYFGDFLSEEERKGIFGNPELKSSQKISRTLDTLKQRVSERIKKAKSGTSNETIEAQSKKIEGYEKQLQQLQQQHKEAINQEKRSHEKVWIEKAIAETVGGANLINKQLMKAAQQTVTNTLFNSYHPVYDYENHSVKLMNRENPEMLQLDNESKTVLDFQTAITGTLANMGFLSRNNGQKDGALVTPIKPQNPNGKKTPEFKGKAAEYFKKLQQAKIS